MLGWPRRLPALLLIGLLLPCAIVVIFTAAMNLQETDHYAAIVQSGNPSGVDSISSGQQLSGQSSTLRHTVEIRRPTGPPRVITTLKDASGEFVTVACSTCHTTRPPNHQNKSVRELDEFHSGMAFSHGTVSCLSCHNSEDYDSLKLADGAPVEFTSVMTLCGQCHGPQLKDYQHGAHGGMNGYWDLTRGPQQKNNCVDCHDPHSPQFPHMKPVFKPRDRFLEQSGTEH
ncbi:MAG: hypothetical protein JNL58_03655 [Planctomyces sp.]|nr:hypothetical protein [Planctomyces sp.]